MWKASFAALHWTSACGSASARPGTGDTAAAPGPPARSPAAAARADWALAPPKHILNAPTKLMKSEGYGSGYAYDHDQEEAFSGQDYFPEELERHEFYRPTGRGFEKELARRLEYWAELRAKRKAANQD